MTTRFNAYNLFEKASITTFRYLMLSGLTNLFLLCCYSRVLLQLPVLLMREVDFAAKISQFISLGEVINYRIF
jgi:hypothetical protein